MHAGKPSKRKFVYFIRNGRSRTKAIHEIETINPSYLACNSHSNGETTEYLTFDRYYVLYAVDGLFSSHSRSCKSDSTVKSLSQFPASSSNRPGPKWPRAVGAQSTMPNNSCRSPVEDPAEVCSLSSVTTRSSYRSFLDCFPQRHRLGVSSRSNDTVVMGSSPCTL